MPNFCSYSSPACRKNQQYDCKWYIPLTELTFQGPEEAEPVTIPQVPDEELDATKVKISHFRSEIQREKVAWIQMFLKSFMLSLRNIQFHFFVISESQQGFKSDRAAEEEAVWAGVSASADVSQHVSESPQQEWQGDMTAHISSFPLFF